MRPHASPSAHLQICGPQCILLERSLPLSPGCSCSCCLRDNLSSTFSSLRLVLVQDMRVCDPSWGCRRAPGGQVQSRVPWDSVMVPPASAEPGRGPQASRAVGSPRRSASQAARAPVDGGERQKHPALLPLVLTLSEIHGHSPESFPPPVPARLELGAQNFLWVYFMVEGVPTLDLSPTAPWGVGSGAGAFQVAVWPTPSLGSLLTWPCERLPGGCRLPREGWRACDTGHGSRVLAAASLKRLGPTRGWSSPG